MAPLTFNNTDKGDVTYWSTKDHPLLGGGWQMPWSPSDYLGKDDAYWNDVRDRARVAFGDPNIDFNDGGIKRERYLVFDNGQRVPQEIIYRDTTNNKVWLQNDDGSVTQLTGPSVTDHRWGKDSEKYGPVTVDGEGVTKGTTIRPAGYELQKDGLYRPVDENGQQIGPLTLNPRANDRRVMQTDPATGRLIPEGSGVTDEKVPPDKSDPDEPKLTVDLKGMPTPEYPDWAYDPAHGGSQAIPEQMATILVELYSMFGTGEQVPETFSKFPVDVFTGANLGIDDYGTNSALKDGFMRLRDEFGAVVTEFNSAIESAKGVTDKSEKISFAGKRAITDEIDSFNDKTAVMTDPDWPRLLDAEAKLLDNVEQIVDKAAKEPSVVAPLGNPLNTNTDVPGLGSGTSRRNPLTSPSLDDGTSTPRGSTLGGSTLSKDTGDSSTEDQISRLLSGLSAGLSTDTSTSNSSDGWSSGLSSALSGLSGLSNLSNLGTSLASSARPTDTWDRDDKDQKDEDDEKHDEKDEAVESLAPPVTPTQGVQAQAVPGQATVVEPQEGTVQPASAVAAAGPGAKLTVTLPDGRVVEAPNAQAAEAARNALADSDGSGDAAQKAYAGTGVEIPSDGKNPGAKVDPSDLQPGDIAKWEDKTMVVVAPGLLAVPGEPDSVITVAEALEKSARGEAQGGSTGFEGFYRPTESADPTLSSAASPPPLTDPQPTPPVEDNKDTSPPAEPDSPSKSQPAVPPGGDEPEPAAPPSDQQSPPPSQDPPVPQKDPQQESSPKAPTAPRAETNALVEPQPAPPSPFAPSPDVPPATRTTKQERIVAGQS